MDWLTGYNCRKQMTIAGSAGGAQTNYALKLIVYRSVGADSGNEVYLNNQCKVDFADIRFAKSDKITVLSHWRQEYIENDYAIFWIEFDSIPASPDSAIFYIYYGNFSANTASDDSGSFLAGADFDDGATTTLTINTAGSASVTVPAITQLFSKLKVDDWIKCYLYNPVLAKRAGKWDSTLVRDLAPVIDEDGFLVKESGKIIALYRGYNGSANQVGRATSVDEGLTWADRLDSPVIALGGVGSWYENVVCSGSTMKRASDGLYIAFCGGKDAGNTPRIGTFTSTDLGLTWADGGSKVELGDYHHPSGTITYMNIPWVIKREIDYIMLFEASTNGANWLIFAATTTSLAGTWAPFNGGNPILPLGTAGQWDDLAVANPKLVRLAANQYLLAYNGQKSGVGKWMIGFATATTDFTSWTKHTGNPVIQAEGTGWEQTETECSAMVRDVSTYLRFWYQGYDGSNLEQIGLAKCHNGRLLHAYSGATADGWVIGSIQPNAFWASLLIRHTADASDDSTVFMGLYDSAAVPSPTDNTTFNALRRFFVQRRSPTNATNPNKFYIIYLDAAGTAHFWDGAAWQATATYFGDKGLYEIRVWDDGTNFNADIIDFWTGLSVLANVAGIATASVKAFSNGRALIYADPYNNYFYLGQDFDDVVVRKYVSPEPTWGAWGVAEGQPYVYLVGNLDLVYGGKGYLIGNFDLIYGGKGYLIGNFDLVYGGKGYLIGNFDLIPGNRAYLPVIITLVDRVIKPSAGSVFMRTSSVAHQDV